MTQEDKELLLKDLSARWMTALKCAPSTKNSIVAYCTVDGIKKDVKGGSFIELADRDSDGNALASTSTNEFDMVKPYLRPISSMTEEEKHELYQVFQECPSIIKTFPAYAEFFIYADIINSIDMVNVIDWLNAHHFDYRGLIEKGLALEASESLYKT